MDPSHSASCARISCRDSGPGVCPAGTHPRHPCTAGCSPGFSLESASWDLITIPLFGVISRLGFYGYPLVLGPHKSTWGLEESKNGFKGKLLLLSAWKGPCTWELGFEYVRVELSWGL